jgi:hypothetical protein
MRLIHTKTKTLMEFESTEAPPYAILSHTWSGAEITYQDLINARKAGKEAGYAKLENGCRVAAAAGFEFFWLDTCCIDKTNMVELSEAINSMFQWYKRAGICFAYLADVTANDHPLEAGSCFFRSRWFRRGWTLQELLAPSEVIFLASNWTELGSRTTFDTTIEEITGIPSYFLLGNDLEHACVAMRMSWASNRETTKAEDIAYCLLGIFDIQMPLLYGERAAGAFRRLQQKIMETSDDQTIFAWTTDSVHTPLHDASARQTFSMLAHSPAWFSCARDFIEAKSLDVPGYLEGIRTPTVFNNKGLHLSLPIILSSKEPRSVLAILNCSDYGKEKEERIAIRLHDVSTNGGRYVRVEQHRLEVVSVSDIKASAAYSSISAIKGEEETRRPPRPTIQFSMPVPINTSVATGGMMNMKREFRRLGMPNTPQRLHDRSLSDSTVPTKQPSRPTPPTTRSFSLFSGGLSGYLGRT